MVEWKCTKEEESAIRHTVDTSHGHVTICGQETMAQVLNSKNHGVPWCKDCRDGEHENYSPAVDFVIVREPDSRYDRLHPSRHGFRPYRPSVYLWMCTDHQEMYLSDGYLVQRCRC